MYISKYEKFIITLCVLLIPFVIYFSYKAYRYANWKMSYEQKVIEQIKIEVKKECLK